MKKRKSEVIYPVDERSTRSSFDLWLFECGNDLADFDGVLSFSGSDGPKITDFKVGTAHFTCPEEVEQFLIDYGAYENQLVMGDVPYSAPKVHYIDWFREKIMQLESSEL